MKLLWLICGLVSVQVNAAMFTVLNKGTVPVTFPETWISDDKETVIEPGSSVTFNTLFANVYTIGWRISAQNTRRSFYVPVYLGYLNLGGSFQIFDNGHYSYYFGVDGSGQGIAKASN